ncbi:MAG: putative zinc-binding metallopeptidase [Candidatus Competibacterales bacterium]
MKLFECQHCHNLVYFENVRCERCGHALGFIPELGVLSALEPLGDGNYRALAAPDTPWRYCANAAYDACNWLVPAANNGPEEGLCPACELNRTIPDLDEADNLRRWRLIEVAKHRLIYTLLRLKLPITSKTTDPNFGLAFDFLADVTNPQGKRQRVFTGHAEGLVTLNIAEADDAEREKTRLALGEPYRTLLGHLRHEVGHYYWDRLVAAAPDRLTQFREMYGDERADYGEALEGYYQYGPATAWSQGFVSAYASAHPWEDWAETWAHYLHMVDTLETAYAFGLRLRPRTGQGEGLATRANFDPFEEEDFEEIFDAWLPLTFAVNSLNRSMGQPDLYPFVLAPPAIAKMAQIHTWVRTGVPSVPPPPPGTAPQSQ